MANVGRVSRESKFDGLGRVVSKFDTETFGG